ncbi:RidA family protein [Conexibacter woesei]|uniref:Endoribonuclease L-PSP n=1 Tax=Conexibacter woesei (strain DSM 14684 / CCUG 47730 / CIP 108061 / JCM 11494 / NBRC 100937 / ID131577) TaxID=469383 RepID=D3F9D2_CONWI|nr:RidA family protein [Conexibacter woesei]ADB49099.1 endoribonuclease L-PSP [Conexibacter woesei DSM 14684]
MPDPIPLNSPAVPDPIGPYSHAVRHGDVLYCTGQLPVEPTSATILATDVAEQARRCLENLGAVCAAAGTGLERAIRIGIYMRDLAGFQAVNAVYAEYFPDPPPARTTIGVAALPMGALIEMDAIVALAG